MFGTAIKVFLKILKISCVELQFCQLMRAVGILQMMALWLTRVITARATEREMRAKQIKTWFELVLKDQTLMK